MDSSSNNGPWNTQMEDALRNVLPADWIEEAEACWGSKAETWELPECGNLSFGVTLGTHCESGSEVFQFNDDRYRHTVILGRTGAGKSNHIQQMEREDIRNGAGVFILAAHEDDAIYPLSCVPEGRLDDVVFIDASNPEYLPRMNPFDVDTGDRSAVNKAVEDVLELVTMDCEYGWAGPRFEHYLRNAAELLLSDPKAGAHCVNDLNKAFTDPGFVKDLLKYVTNKEVYDFWTKVFPQEQKSNDAGEMNAWVLAKMSRFATDRTLGHFFGAGKSTVDIRHVVDEGKILIAYVPESRIGSIAARTISKWLVMQLRDAIMTRRTDSDAWRGLNYSLYEERQFSTNRGFDPFFVYVDEFAKFATTDFEGLLAEARKQHVGFVLSAQTLSQTRVYDRKAGHTTSGLAEAILGNVGSMICYPVGGKDAELLASQFDVDVEKLKRIERYKPLARLCVDNQITRPGTLEVRRRPTPDTLSAARRVARNQLLFGSWIEVEGASDKGAFFRAINGPKKGGEGAKPCNVGGEGDEGGRTYKGNDDQDHRTCAERPRRSVNGLGIAYRYADPKTGSYAWAAEKELAVAVGHRYETYWVVYRDGHIDHAASIEEWREELEVRIGNRIAEGLPEEKLDEYDRIQDQSEATRWLEENRPDYRDIVNRTCREMERGLVMDDGEGVPPKV